MNRVENNNNFFDKCIWILTALLYMSFYTFNYSIIIMALFLIELILIVINNKGKIRICASRLFLFITAFVCWCFITCLWALDFKDPLEKGNSIIQILIILCILYTYFIKIGNAFEVALKIILYGGYGVVIYSFIVYGYDIIIKTMLSSQRLDFLFIGVNSIGAVTSITLILTTYFILFESFRIEYLMAIPAIALLVACGSRRSLIVFGVGVAVILGFYLRQGGKIKLQTKIVVIVVLIMAILFFIKTGIFSGINERIIQMFSGEAEVDHSSLLRREYVQLGIDIFKEHPLSGIGIGCAHIVNNMRLGYDTYLHNNYVELLADGGIFALLIYYYPHFYAIKKSVRLRKTNSRECMLIILLIIICLVNDIGVVSYYAKETYFILMVIFIGIGQITKEEKFIAGDYKK